MRMVAASATPKAAPIDRKSTRLNSSHLVISYAVFCLKKKKTAPHPQGQRTHQNEHPFSAGHDILHLLVLLLDAVDSYDLLTISPSDVVVCALCVELPH